MAHSNPEKSLRNPASTRLNDDDWEWLLQQSDLTGVQASAYLRFLVKAAKQMKSQGHQITLQIAR